jgi:hypothetical protein
MAWVCVASALPARSKARNFTVALDESVKEQEVPGQEVP